MGEETFNLLELAFNLQALSSDRLRNEGGKTPGAADAPGEAMPRRGLLKAPGGEEDKQEQATEGSRGRAGGTRVGRGLTGLGEGATAQAF